MAYGKTYSYTLRFDADVSNVRTQVQSALNQLTSIARNDYNLSYTTNLKQAQVEAVKLGKILQSSFNVDTNHLDLTKLTTQLNASGLSASQLSKTFSGIGPDGVRAFQDVASAISKAEQPAFRLNGVLDNLWITMKNTMRWQLTSSMLHGFVGTVQTAWRYAQDLDESLTSIRVVTGQNIDQMAEFAQEANRAAQALHTTTVNYTDASLIYYQQGLDAEEVKERTDITINAANAAGTSAEKMSEYLTAVWNSYQVATDQLESYVDKMAAVGANTATSLEEISTAMVNVASTANTVGVSMDQLTAIISTVASTTRQSATTIGTAYKTIFARMGDLKLGETLEDGLDLGTVSKQLESIGVDILNVNGDLREMGTVVEEVGEKWQTWTTAQQTAVAQAIAGKRQYTQLIALFDNWDAYQNALSISENSEGTLAEQAATFAEGWEAARRDVKAAAEGIYDSLINPQGMAKLDKALASTFNRIENIVDGMGGFFGVLSGTSTLLLTIFGDKLANSLRSAQQGILDLTGAQEKLNSEMRKSFVNEAIDISEGNKHLAERFNILMEYENQRKDMSKTQQQEVEIGFQIYDFISKQLEAVKEVNANLQEQRGIYESIKNVAGDRPDMYTQTGFGSRIFSGIESNQTREHTIDVIARSYQNEIGTLGILPIADESQAIAEAEKKVAEEELKILDRVRERAQVLGGVSQIQKRIVDLKRQANVQDTATTNLTDEQKNKMLELVNIIKTNFNIDGLTDNAKRELENLNKLVQNSDVSWAQLEQQVNITFNSLNTLPTSEIRPWMQTTAEQIQTMADRMRDSGSATVQEKELLAALEDQLNRISGTLQTTSAAHRDWAATVISVSRGLSTLGMALSSTLSLGRTWNDFIEGNVSLLDTLVRSLTTIGMVLPTAVTGFKALNASVVAGTGLIGKLGSGIIGLGASATVATGGIAALIAGLGILAVIGVKAFDNWIHRAEKAREAIDKVREETENTRNEVSNLNDELETTKERIEELLSKDSLTPIEQEELTKLQEAEASLERQLAIQEKLHEINLKNERDSLRENAATANKELVSGRDTYDDKRNIIKGGLSGKELLDLESTLDENDPLYKMLQNDELIQEVLDTLPDQIEEGVVSVEEWWNSLSETQKNMKFFQEYYAHWLEENKQRQDDWVSTNFDSYQKAEEDYSTWLELEKKGLLVEGEIESARNDLAQARKNIYGDDYYKNFISPLFKDQSLKNEYQDIFTSIIDTEKFDDELSDTLQEKLLSSGVAVQEFLDAVTEHIEVVKDNMSGLASGSEIDEFLKELSSEDLGILFSINFENEDLRTLDDVLDKIQEIKVQAAMVDFSTMRDSAKEALATLAKGDLIDKETAEKLRETFKDFYDLTNLEGLSLYDQASVMGEALQMAIDPVAQLMYLSEDLRDAWNTYNDELAVVAEKQIDLEKTVYGNIDTNNRQVLEWTEDNLIKFQEAFKSWGYTIEDLKDSFSTVMGTSAEYDGIEIAFSPILQTSNGPVLLDANTVDEYIFGLIEEAGEEWSSEELLALDTKGIEKDGLVIKNLIADIGDTAIATGEAMHFTGAKGSIAELKSEFDDLFKKLSKNMELDPIQIDFDIEHAKVDAVIAQFKAIENAAGAIGEKYRVSMDDISTIAENLPQLLQGAFYDVEKNVWQLKQSTVEAVSAQVEEEAAMNAAGLQAQLQNRYDWLQENLTMIDSVVKNAEEANAAELTSEILFNGKTEEEKKRVIGAMIKARIQQYVQNTQMSSQETSNEIHDMNEVGDAADEQSARVTKYWADAMELADSYFLTMAKNAIQNMNAIASKNLAGLAQKGTYSAARRTVGSSGSASLYSYNTEKATSPVAALEDYVNNDFKLAAEDNAIKREVAINEIIRQFDEIGYKGMTQGDIVGGIDTIAEKIVASYKDRNNDGTNKDEVIAALNGAKNDIYYELKEIIPDLTALYQIGNTGKTLSDAAKSKSSSSKSKTSDTDLKKMEERYHEINKLIEEQERLLKETQTQIDRTYGAGKLKEYNKEQERLNDLINSQQTKMEEARGWATKDLATIKSLGLIPEISDQGRVTNYTQLLQQATDDYNAFLAQWNAHANETANGEEKTWQQLNEQRKKQEEKKYQDRLDALKKFEESVSTYWTEYEKREQYLRDLEDNKLKKIAAVIEFQVDFKNAKKDVRELSKDIAEAIGDALNHWREVANLNFDNMKDEMGMYDHYLGNFNELAAKVEESFTNKYIDQEELKAQLESLRENVIGSAEALIEWAESVEEIVPDAIDAARERFDQFTDQLDHNTSIIDTIKEIMVLQGLTLKTQQGYNDLRDMYTKRMDATLAKAKLNRQWYDNALKELQIAQAAIDNATEGTEEYDILKANRDALLAEFNEAQQAMLDSAKETMETAREMYIDGVERTAYELEQVLTKGDGFDLLQDKYDHYIDTEERYLDTVNKIYETTKLNNKLQEQIDKTTNSAHAKRLKELQEEFQEREKNNKLSEYDIEIMNAKLAMLTKQMELEDAANNKSTLRVVRNSRGNYDYQFTANPDDINSINQEYLDAAQEYYNIAKDKVKEVSGEIIDTWQEMTDKIKEIYEDETLTIDEREAQIAEIREYYTQKVKDLESEKQKAIVDMTEAGNIAINDFREAHKDVLAGMGDDVDGFKDKFSDDLAAILEGTDDFNNQFAEDLDDLSEAVDNFDVLFDDTINKMEEHVDEFNEKVREVNDDVGVSYDDLKDVLDQVADSTEEVTRRGQDQVMQAWEQISAAQQLSQEYAMQAQEVMNLAMQYRDLARAINELQFNRLGSAGDMDYDSSDFVSTTGPANIDYSVLMAQGIASGQLTYGSDAYNKLMNFRDSVYEERGGAAGGLINNKDLDKIFRDQASGNLSGSSLAWFNKASGEYTGRYDNNQGDFEYWLRRHGISSFATGGYTGDFDNGKLSILHEKELVLNEDDTKNILNVVDTVRGLNTSVWLDIAKALDSSVLMLKGFLANKISPAITVEGEKETLEQKVEIQASFPGVQDAREIEEALSNIVNNAAQFASQRE